MKYCSSFAICLLLCNGVLSRVESGVARRDKVKKKPEPLIVETTQWWDGNDGPWSSFKMQIGTGSLTQNVRLFPSTSLPETYVIHPKGCPNWTSKYLINDQECRESRGGLFDHTRSGDSYVSELTHNVGSNAAFNTFGFRQVRADIGWDTVKFGYPQRNMQDSKLEDRVTIEHSLVAELTDWNYTWLGLLGIDPRPTNLSGQLGEFKGAQQSLLSKLKTSAVIPSQSWSYTAGSRYYEGGAQGSLVLGGYDANRMNRNNLVFPFHDDVERVHTVWVEEIQLYKHGSEAKPALHFGKNETNFQSHIDSSRPYIYLPVTICEQIASELSLEYNPKNDHYLITNETYSNLKSFQQPNLTFAFTPLNRGSKDVNPLTITLPYTSLLLKLDHPLVDPGNVSWYVPIRRAASEKQYVLGRTFLQNAYLISDYERRHFYVHEAKIESPAGPSPLVRPIFSEDLKIDTLDSWQQRSNSASSGEHSSRTLSKAVITAIAICATILVVLIGLLVFWRRRKHNAKAPSLKEDDIEEKPKQVFESEGTPVRPLAEMESPVQEMPGVTGFLVEADADAEKVVHEMEGSSPSSPILHTPLEFYDRSLWGQRIDEVLEKKGSDETSDRK